MYGMFLASASLLILQFQINNSTNCRTRSLLLSNASVHGALINIHLFGILYSGVFLLAQMAFDRSRRIFRTKLYAAIVLSWTTLIFYLPSFFNQADAGSPRFWLPSPDISHFVGLIVNTLPSYQIAVVLAVVCLALIFTTLFGRGRDYLATIPSQKLDSERPLLVIASALLLVPIGVFVISQIKPLFLGRYMIPTVLTWAIFIAAGGHRIITWLESSTPKGGSTRARSVSVLSVFLAACIIYPLWTAITFPTQETPGSSDAKYGYENLPMVVQRSHDFVTRLYYSPAPERYFFILDWPSAVDETSGRFPPQEFKHLEALKREYPTTFKNVVESERFLQATSRFLILTNYDYNRKCSSRELQCPRWLADRLLVDPHFRIELLGHVEGRALLLVERTVK
jgi:hypothetical protein